MKRFLPASLALLTFLATWAYRNLFEATQQGAYLAGLGLHTFVGPLQPYVRLTLITFAIAWILLHVDQALQTNNKFGLAFCAFSLCAGAFIALLSQVSPGNSQETIN